MRYLSALEPMMQRTYGLDQLGALPSLSAVITSDARGHLDYLARDRY